MDFSTTVAAILSLFIFSFLYRDNPFYKFAEHLLVGVSVGYFLVISIDNVLVPKIADRLLRQNDWSVIVPLLAGALILARLIPKWSRWSQLALAVVIGVGAGVAIPATLQAQILTQMKATMFSFIPPENSIGWLYILERIVILLGLTSVLAYFFFSKEHRGVFGTYARIGTYFLMIFFGATFGYTVMSRLSLLIGRIQFLLGDWLGFLN
ncbi:MAG: hypothetical protein A2V86_04310 [Deltaproteobacteria bacterium RBG_16_49_23]|nr:MAG: hypothetical protein A2V86_04310 [Deltaproteobacteria bacterium RBG_16_49_23]